MLEQYQKSLLSSGIRVITEKIPTVHSVAIGAWVNVGGRQENLENQGISHFLEHMIFKGTKNRSALDIALEIESVGGQINAFTGKELTCFFAHILDEYLDKAVEVLADITANSRFLAEEIEKEKSVIIEEINNLEDTPEDLIYDYFIKELYPQHSLGYSILGTKETVNSFHSQDLRSLIKKKYTSDKVVIAAAGNLEHSELCDLVEKNFSFASAAKPHPVKKIPPVSAKRLEWNRSIAQSHIIIGTRSFQYSDRRKYPFLVLNTILGGGMSSRLFQSIRETFGLAYSVYTFTESLSDTGMWGVYIGTDRNKVENVIALVLAEFGKIIKDKITAHELARIKAQLKGNLMLGLEGTSSRMNRLAKMEIYLHDFISLDSIIEEIDKVQLEEVVEVANEVLDRNKLLTIIFTP